MRYNKQELAALASQTSHNFDHEGVLVLKEKQDGFFRRSEGCSARWFRLKGNLLFYLKGPEPLHEPLGVIVLGQHTVKEQNQDENGHWPFHIIWENRVCFRMATFNKADRTNWIDAIQNAPYSVVQANLNSLKEKLDSMRPIVDISTYRMEQGIVSDMTEIPLCELALSCDNLLCDANGKPPSPVLLVYIRPSKGVCIKYGATEIVESCSNPCFSKTILFRASDGLTGETLVRIVAYHVREQVTDTAVLMGFTSLKLSTIQEAQRLRVALTNPEKKTVGFVTIHGWSLEPSHLGASPTHSDEGHSIDLPQKVTCHRRSQSLPPRLGLKLKFPIYGNLMKQNFLNSHQVTYRFHSGLGGDITVHEIMSEVKFCYELPVQLLDIYIKHETELMQELLSVQGLSTKWRARQIDLADNHITLLKHYCYSKHCLQSAENQYFKPSSKKDDSKLEFAPVNLHLQRMWVNNDTLNRNGFYNVVTSGAFALHKRKAEKTGGLIRLVQEVKDINSAKAALNSATANKIQASLDNVCAIQRLCEEAGDDMDRILVLLQANQQSKIRAVIEAIKEKIRSILALWEPIVLEETFAQIGWPENTTLDLEFQIMMYGMDDIGSPSSKRSRKNTATAKRIHQEASILRPVAGTSKQEPDAEDTQLQFQDEYFSSEERQKYKNYSVRPIRSPVQTKWNVFRDQKSSFKWILDNSRSDNKILSAEPCSSKSLVDIWTDGKDGKGTEKKAVVKTGTPTFPDPITLDPRMREIKLELFKKLGKAILLKTEEFFRATISILNGSSHEVIPEVMDCLGYTVIDIKEQGDIMVRWAKVGHAALRILCEEPSWAEEHAALQIRRDTCFSQALVTVTSGLLCWLNSVPGDVIVKLLSSDLGPLCGFEGLLSLFATEKAMWGDMVVAIEDLQTVLFTLTKVGHSKSATPQVSGTRGSVIVSIPVSESLYSRFTCTEDRTFTITAVFFNIGINEKADMAEALGDTTPQYQSNCDNLERLNKYYQKYNKIFPADHMAAIRASSRTKPLEEVMENLRIAVQKKGPKNTDVLYLSSLATRLMNGVRFTSCKSGKDRTGMAVTLEQCCILASEYHLAENEMKKALNIMRSEGCRRENTYKNIGVRKYAFTKKQAMALPEEYQPPAGTYGATQT